MGAEKLKVAICGSGAAAAFAALACLDARVTFDVFGQQHWAAQKAGAFFVHWLPEWAGGVAFPVEISSTGTPEQYINKQWGRQFPSSFPTAARREMWYTSNALMHAVREVPVKGWANITDTDLLDLSQRQGYDLVLHTFPSESSKWGRVLVNFPVLTGHMMGFPRIVYDGTDAPWTRITVSLSGAASVEYAPGAEVVPHPDLYSNIERVELRDIPPYINKLQPDDWLGGRIVPIGRYATWDRKMLSHDCYNITVGAIAAVLNDMPIAEVI